MLLFLKGIQETLEKFSHYKPIWERSRDEILAEFLTGNPALSEFEQAIKGYEDLNLEIDSEPRAYNVGPVAITTGKLNIQPIKTSLKISIFNHGLLGWF